MILMKDPLTTERALSIKAQSLGSQWESTSKGLIFETTLSTIQSIRLILPNRSTTHECKGTSPSLRHKATTNINSHQESESNEDLKVILLATN